MPLLRAWIPLVFLLRVASGALCSVVSPPYSAVCDNRTDDRPAIQRALDDAACADVVVPAGRACVSRALNLSSMSGRALLVDGELVVWREPASYSQTKHNQMFLSATDGDGAWTGPLLEGFTLGGHGRIVGGGAAWWPLGSSVVRPRILWIPNASTIVITNITIVDSPAWNIGMRGHGLRITNVRVEAGLGSCGGFGHAPNTDGANLGGHDIAISGLWVHNGDDCIPITTGNDGTTSGVLAEGVHCECGTNGLVIYNQGGAVSNVTARNFTVVATNQGAGVKLARPGRDATNGSVTDVTFGPDYVIEHPRYAALYVNVFQEDAQPPCTLPAKPDLPHWLTARNIAFSGVSATVANGQAAGCFRCTPAAPCDASFDSVDVRDDSGKPAGAFVCHNMHGAGAASVPAACARD